MVCSVKCGFNCILIELKIIAANDILTISVESAAPTTAGVTTYDRQPAQMTSQVTDKC